MPHPILASILAFAAQAADPPPLTLPQLTLPQQTSLRCSAAFALVQRDRNTEPGSLPDYSNMDVRGKEFFIRTGLQLMEETGILEEQYEAMIYAELDQLAAPEKLAEVMPGCFLLLEASGI